tara:strand:- start:707 stop:1039 length:333 start_codon:yes stop_codon:yes gene_type:complete
MSTVSTILISKTSEYSDIFDDKLIFKELTDEHVVRLVMLQKIKKAKQLDDSIKIYLNKLELEDLNLNQKLLDLLKYESGVFNIAVLDISEGFNSKEIKECSDRVRYRNNS